MKNYNRWAALILLLAGALGISVMAKPASVTPDDPLLAAKQEWSLVGGDPGDTHYSSSSQIDTQSVKSLGAAWVSKKFEDGATSRVIPVVKDGLMFLTAGTRVYALDPTSGQVIWTYQSASGSGVAPGPTDLGAFAYSAFARENALPNNEGVAAGDGKVFVGVTTGHVIALDEKTGKVAWNHTISYEPPRSMAPQVSAAPIYADGIVFCNLESDEAYVGLAIALDGKDGHELWRFHTIPAPGEPGHETWPQNSNSWQMGASNIWHPAAVDPDLGLVFYGTGSADPIQGGELRPGNNLYTNSVLALDIKTGKLRWYYQLTHHDIWDTDIAIPLALYNAQVNGRTRKGVAAMRADGYLFLLDRETGKPLIPTQERPVIQSSLSKTSPTQPYPVGGESVLVSGENSNCAEWKDKIPAGFVLSCSAFTPSTLDPANVLAPSVGVRVQPMSFDPQTGYFYVQGAAGLAWRRRAKDPYFFLNGAHVPGLSKLSYTSLAAIDSRTDKVVWEKQLPPAAGLGSGGMLSTAGGLVFHRREDGTLDAYDAKTGDVLWKFQIGYVGSSATPMSYEIDGQQYIAMIAGSEVWSFRLGGSIPPRPAPRMPAPSDSGFVGPIADADSIAAASVMQMNWVNSVRYYIDDYSVNPYRIRVKAGTPVTFGNNGSETHEFAAVDGSWTTGPLSPDMTVTLTFDKPGSYTYICKKHPWTYGQIIVVDKSTSGASGAGGSAPGSQGSFADQAARGKAAYAQSCSGCHMADLSGNGQAAPPVAGTDFLAHWQGRTAGDLFDKIRTTMPTGNPASLNKETYLNIVAYLLQVNEVPAAKELNEDTLKAISLSK